jgi:hypothetical protein
MNSIVWKSGIIAVFFILSHCDNDTSSTLHPLLNLEVERLNDTSRVLITTTVAEHYLNYRIVDDTCTLKITYHAIINEVDTVIIDSVAIANDSAAFQSGTFHGVWVVPDSLLSHDTTRVYGCVSDDMKHDACASLILYGNNPPPQIRY